MHGNIQVFDDVNALLDALVCQWLKIAKESIADHGAFHVALAGGSTPKIFYSRLAEKSTADFIAWDKVHFYFGDERYVPQNDVDSNYRMVYEALFSKVDISESQIHAMVIPSLTPENNAQRYARLIERQLKKDASGRPTFDLILLGVGEDGHTASLFPDTEILNEVKKSVAAQFVDKLGVWRVSLTYPTLNAANHVFMLMVGESKSEMFLALSESAAGDIHYPVLRINPQGDFQWFLDKAAAHLAIASETR